MADAQGLGPCALTGVGVQLLSAAHQHMKQYKKELEFAKKLALKAGKIIRKNFIRSKITIKSDLSPVTETDIAVSKLINKEVKKNFPDHVVLDEEINKVIPKEKYVWVCDPVDGTIPFSHYTPTSMFSLALCEEGEPVVAVIFDPYFKRLLYTKKGDKTYMNGKKISVDKKDFKEGDIVYGDFRNPKLMDINKFFQVLKDNKLKDSWVESIVYQVMLVANGTVKALITSGAHPWDRAASILIIKNCGGKFTDEKGNEATVFRDPNYNVITNGTVHKKVLGFLKRCLIKD